MCAIAGMMNLYAPDAVVNAMGEIPHLNEIEKAIKTMPKNIEKR